MITDSQTAISLMSNYVALDPDHLHSNIRLYRVRDAKLIWLNMREAILDPIYETLKYDPTAYETYLVDACSYHAHGIPEHGMIECPVDRYGGSGIGTNGGSGRSAYIGGYYVKGIGRTSLISHDIDEHHASGGCYLQEAVREAVFGELIQSELPGGAIGILAIVDLGRVREWDDHIHPQREREVLIIRRQFLRPAHFMRAYHFSGDKPDTSKYDFVRTKRTHERMASSVAADTIRSIWTDLSQTWGAQVAYSFIHRIDPGPISPSNIDITGRIVDFGASTTLPSWQSFRTTSNGQISGDEIAEIGQVFTDLEFYASQLADYSIGLDNLRCQLIGSFHRQLLKQAYRLFVHQTDLFESIKDNVKLAADIYNLRILKIDRSVDFYSEIHSKSFTKQVSNRISDRMTHDISIIFANRNFDFMRPRDRKSGFREVVRHNLHKILPDPDDEIQANCILISNIINDNIVKCRNDSRYSATTNEICGFFRNNNVGGIIVKKECGMLLIAEWSDHSNKLKIRLPYTVISISDSQIRIDFHGAEYTIWGSVELCQEQ